ncbi:MAG: primosomal protein N' [FCB group bacterium]|nr:primosomal protein N' [FCB group bacterium]
MMCENTENNDTKHTGRFAQVSLPLPQDELFTYSIPLDLTDSVVPGVRVIVPFASRVKTAVVIGLTDFTDIDNIREIIDLADNDPPLPRYLIDFCRWISDYYCCSLGETLQTAHPAGMLAESKKMVRLKTELENELLQFQAYSDFAGEIIETLSKGKAAALKTLRKRINSPGLMKELQQLEKRGIIEIYEDFPGRVYKPKYEILLTLNPEVTEEYLESWLNKNEKSKPRQVQVVRYLQDSPPVSRKTLLMDTKVSSPVLTQLVKQKLLSEKRREIIRDTAWYLPENSIITHTEEQLSAIDAVKRALDAGGFAPFLLHGVTGSGKTEVYLEIIAHCLKRGGTAIVLVPEIALTPQIASRFRRRFGGQVVIIHSRISPGEKYDSWRRLAQGRARVVIGARSALFAPMKNLGLIVIDEEHKQTFKQEEKRPYYNARDSAVVLAQMLKIPVVLGSATPSIETYENALRGKYKLLELPYRVAGGKFSQLKMVDLTQKNAVIGKTSISIELMEAIDDRISRGDKTIILQNRRGFSTFIKCLHCKAVETCINCSVTLTYHITNQRLRCHICGFQKRAPSICSQCGGSELIQCGTGTQRVEDELSGLFPDARICRMDMDTTTGIDSHFRILEAFQQGKYDILLGTQMVAKGLDFPDVTLVGIISADTELLRPDFRSEERTFRLLIQAAGRSGRHRPGEGIVQTYNSEHKIYNFVKNNDYTGFFAKTLRDRKSLNYPPFGRLIALRISGFNEEKVAAAAAELARAIPRGEYHLLGPSQALLYKVKNRFRYNILVKMPILPQHKLSEIKKTLNDTRTVVYNKYRKDKISIEIDPDPISLL